MKLIRTRSQKDSIAKFFWDMAKIDFGALLIGPLARGEEFHLRSIALGIVVGLLLCLGGYLFDGMEVES